MALFTAETAREMALRSHAPTSARHRLPEPPPTLPQPADCPADEIRQVELKRVRARLDKLDELMAAAETDREWDNLSRAYERVFRAWVHLAGIPGPGQLKPIQARTKPAPVEPLEQ